MASIEKKAVRSLYMIKWEAFLTGTANSNSLPGKRPVMYRKYVSLSTGTLGCALEQVHIHVYFLQLIPEHKTLSDNSIVSNATFYGHIISTGH